MVPTDPSSPHLGWAVNHVPSSQNGNLALLPATSSLRGRHWTLHFPLSHLALHDLGQITLILRASISPFYANYSSEEK